MSDTLNKKYYRIAEVAQMLDVPQTTLRYWEKCFDDVQPKRNAAGTRYYTVANVERLRIIRFLLYDKGMKIDAARRQLRHNARGMERTSDVVTRLTDVRDTLQQLLDALDRRR